MTTSKSTTATRVRKSMRTKCRHPLVSTQQVEPAELIKPWMPESSRQAHVLSNYVCLSAFDASTCLICAATALWCLFLSSRHACLCLSAFASAPLVAGRLCSVRLTLVRASFLFSLFPRLTPCPHPPCLGSCSYANSCRRGFLHVVLRAFCLFGCF